MSDIDDIRRALSYIEPNDRDDWWHIGAALKDELGENGFEIWDDWSRQADNYNARDAKTTWKSLKVGIWHIESVWKMARQNGWKPSKPFVQLSEAEQAKRKAESDAKRQVAELAQQQAKMKAKRTAQTIWQNSKSTSLNHPYLQAKGIMDLAVISGLRQNQYKNDNNLVIPVMYEREIVNLQFINQDGEKRFLSGGQVQGGYAFIGKAEEVEKGVVIAEGWATAASIHQAVGKPVIVAFNAGNMVKVAERMVQKLPRHTPVIVAADNDASQTGIKKAEQVASLFGERAIAIQAEFTMTQIQQYQRGKELDEQGRLPLPSDFNDLHQLAGIDAVREQIIAGMNRHEKENEEMKSIEAETNQIEFDGYEQDIHKKTEASQIKKTVLEPDSTIVGKEIDSFSLVEESDKRKQVILDLEYQMPDNLRTRYHTIGGKFYSAADGQTILFEDKGKKLKTSRQDPQTVRDMLDVVKAKGWDNIKLSGSKEFKQLMFIEATVQGIQTRGYVPTEADLKQVEVLREKYARNDVEAVLANERNINESLTLQNEKEVDKSISNSQSNEQVYEQVDRELLASAERLKMQSSLPSDSQINMSPRADTDIDIPIHAIGREEIPAEVLQQTNSMTTAAQDTGLVVAKTAYMNKAQKLSKPEQKKLAFYERGVMDSIRGLKGEIRTEALRNYYEHTAKNMHGSKLDLPKPIQIPNPSQVQGSSVKQETYSPSITHDGYEPELSR
ncbi:MAG: LPD7 domain-containing protein [Neisseria sp.]|nr:LPD7 domain-containing protein [Neisseria sp.]